MGGLIQILRVKRQSKSQRNTGTHRDVVGKGCNSAVVDFGLGSRYRVSYVMYSREIRNSLPLQMTRGPDDICQPLPGQRCCLCLSPK